MALQLTTMRSLPFGTHLHLSGGDSVIHPYYQFQSTGIPPDYLFINYEIIGNCNHPVRFSNNSTTIGNSIREHAASGTVVDNLQFHNDGLARHGEFATIRWTAHFRSSPEAERTGTFIISFS